MKIGLIITTYNRPEYLKQCLESLSRADMPNSLFEIVIIDDASEDTEVHELMDKFCSERDNCLPYFQKQRWGIKGSLKNGVKWLVDDLQCEFIINLDGDAIVRNDFIPELIKLHQKFPDHLITGFNCNTLNKDGSVRHKILLEGEGWNMKKTVGGINLAFTPKMYKDWILPALKEPTGNWDQKACLNAGNGVICAVPSLVQHIGLVSSMGHSADQPDVADDFKPLSLPDVTLIGVDSNKSRLQTAFNQSTQDIHFGAVKLLNEPLASKEQYSRYCIKELYKHVETSHLLIIQHDGYVKNWQAWDNSWLQYDYIGAPWEWYTDDYKVGNGGFSLRSKRLMEIVATDPVFNNYHPEDHVICRTYRKHLETTYGIKFAPIEVARNFSIEGYKHWDTRYSNQFGFHSNFVTFEQSGKGKTAYIQQYFGIGDVIFSMQIARNLQKQGHKICWPVLPDYVEQLNRAYPDITFMDVWLTQPKFMEGKELVTRGSTYYVPLRWTYEIMKVPFKDCMRSKYDFMHLKWETWRDAMYERDEERENALFDELGLKIGEPYTLVNRNWKSDGKTTSNFECKTSGKVVEMGIKPGYSLFDWSLVIENATEIHTVSTSIVYILELLDIKCEKCYIYIRRPNEANHDNYRELMTKHIDKYIFV